MRLTDDLERRLRRAAEASGVSISEFMRQAIERSCVDALRDSLYERNKDIFGSVRLGGGVADRAREAFAECMDEKFGRSAP